MEKINRERVEKFKDSLRDIFYLEVSDKEDSPEEAHMKSLVKTPPDQLSDEDGFLIFTAFIELLNEYNEKTGNDVRIKLEDLKGVK
jgi:hypothetical protein